MAICSHVSNEFPVGQKLWTMLMDVLKDTTNGNIHNGQISLQSWTVNWKMLAGISGVILLIITILLHFLIACGHVTVPDTISMASEELHIQFFVNYNLQLVIYCILLWTFEKEKKILIQLSGGKKLGVYILSVWNVCHVVW